MVSRTVCVKESEQTFRGTFYICSINKTRDSIQQPDFDFLSQLDPMLLLKLSQPATL